MYLDPRDGAVLLHGFLEFLDFDSLLFEQAMTVHTDAGGRDSSVSACSRGIVAIQTGNLIVTSVDLVGKGNRLIRGIALMDADAESAQAINPLLKTSIVMQIATKRAHHRFNRPPAKSKWPDSAAAPQLRLP